MPRQLLILRHAKSDWESDASGDFDRPLARRGKHDAPLVGEWLHREGLVPDLVVSSPAERAKETALKVCKSMGLKKEGVVLDPDVYAGGLNDLLRVLARCPAEAASVLLVGHNPGMEELLVFLAGDVADPGDGKLLPTAALARLEMPDDWRVLGPRCAQLVSITRPATLAD